MAKEPQKDTPATHGDLLELEERIKAYLTEALLPIHKHSRLGVCLGVGVILVLVFAGLQTRYGLPALIADVVYGVVCAAEFLVWHRTYKEHRR